MTGNRYDILVVDDEPEITSCLSEVLSGGRFTCTCANSGSEAVDLLQAQRFDVVLTDLVMPDVDGMEVLGRARELRPESQGILISGRLTRETALAARREGAFEVITKPFDLHRVRHAVTKACEAIGETHEAYRAPDGTCTEVEPLDAASVQFHAQFTMSILAALEAKDRFTKEHSIRTRYYAKIIGRELNLPEPQVASLRSAAVVHDVGKLGISDAILTKPGKLTVEEFAMVRRHPRMGYDILKPVDCMRNELPVVLHHHEWWNGSGYPTGLKGEEIPLGARIVHAADAIDAMLSRRSYGRSCSPGGVVEELRAGLGTQFDPRVGAAAIDWMQANPGSIITSRTRARRLAELALA